MENGTNIGRQIGRYKILEDIGHGGMAFVYRAMDTNLEREVALKLLHPHLASHMESRQRFQREAKAVARLKHPSVLEIYDYSDAEGNDVYIVMEIIQGTTLRRFLDQRLGKPLLSEAIALILSQVGAALAHAHANGIVHRDVKPENILIGPKGEVKLSDFGIAHLAGLSQMTVTGQILGSPAYMSPEHVDQVELDARADIFSFGSILYEAGVGHIPFEGQNPHAIIKRIVEGTYNDPLAENPALGHHMAQTIRKCLAPDPKNRYGSAEDLVSSLETFLETMGIGPYEVELNRFFSDPKGWSTKQTPQIITRTLALGLRNRREKRRVEAIDHFNRVLALDPGNEKALDAVSGMSRQQWLRRILERTAIAITVIVVIGVVVFTYLKSAQEPEPSLISNHNPKPSPVHDNTSPPKVSQKPPTPDAGAKKAVPVVLSQPRRINKPVVHRQKKSRVVIFTPQPMAVDIVVDRKRRFSFGPASRKQIMSVGKHTISFVPNDPRRFQEQTWKIRIPSGDTPYYFRERLRWQPAKLLVKCNVNAVVSIRGRVTDKANTPFNVAIRNGPKEKISLLVSANGYIPSTKQVTIAAGELAKVSVSLSRKDPETRSP